MYLHMKKIYLTDYNTFKIWNFFKKSTFYAFSIKLEW